MVARVTLRRCPACATFYDKKTGDCPNCGCPPGVYSSHLVKARLDSHLWGQAAAAHDTQRKYDAIQRGYEIPPTKEQRKAAREIVRDLM